MCARRDQRKSCRKRKSIGFDFHENAAECSNVVVKCGSIGVLEVRKKAPDPRLEMLLEDNAVRSAGSNDLAAGEAGHDFEKDRSVILGFRLSLGSLKANLLQSFADPGEGAPIKITRQII